MPFESFHARFPQIAEDETRTLIVMNNPGIPEGYYGLIEMYCNESGCDCRRVFFDVYDWDKKKSNAYIAYGWEDEEFYANWLFYSTAPEDIKELQGPILYPLSPQSKYAPAFLKLVKGVLEVDQRYVDRLKRHYEMFRETLDDEPDQNPKPHPVRKETKSRKRMKKRAASDRASVKK
ncbi:MAG: hypothetical protein KJ638_15485 [Chloroflexi bacterium]|nr:hypothetical protein [Chloroflexota bacterium]